MKKLIVRNKRLRDIIGNFKNLYFILKSIIKNIFVFIYFKYKILSFFRKNLNITYNFTGLKFCVISLSKKRFNKMSFYSRQLLGKKIHNGKMFGIVKQLW